MISTILDHLRLLGPLRRFRARTRRVRDDLTLACRVLRCKRNYARVLKHLRAKPKNEKIRVLFLCGEPAKWKCQKLYEAMRDSGAFDPIVGLTAWGGQSKRFVPVDDVLDEFHCKAERFFDSLGDVHVRTYSLHPRRGIDLADFNPDIVFYTEPWSVELAQAPFSISKAVLSFYVPYFVPSHGNVRWEAHQEFHRFLFAYVCMNEKWATLFRNSWRWWDHATQFLGLGHPALDFFHPAPNDKEHGTGPVVYAPHFSIPHPTAPARTIIPFSTFEWNGMEILDYAKTHPEMGWVFKPHPVLRSRLEETGMMSRSEIDDYYAAWASLGTVSEDGNYQDLFSKSRAMITDSCSFLTEYGATGKPLIHLIRMDNGVVPLPPSKAVFDSFYQVRNLAELHATFRTVLEEGADPKREERLKAVREAQIGDGNASANVVKHLRVLLRR